MIEFELPPALPESPPPIDPQTRIADETTVEALKNTFTAHQQQVLYSDPDALFRQTGGAAMAGAEPALARLSGTRDALLAQAATPAQRDMLGRALDLHVGVVRSDIDRHVGRQSLDWQKSTAQQRIDLLRKQAAHEYGDPPSIGAYAEASASAALDQARAAGLSPESEAAAALTTAA